MRIRIFQLLSILVVIFSSCSELDEKNGYIAGTPELHDTIYQARNPNLPCVKTRRIDYGKLMFTRASANEDKNGNLGELLGYSYKIGNTILGDPKNVGYQVIDVTKVTDYEPSLISKNHIGQSSINSFSYASYDDFLQKSQLTKKSKSGFSINVFNIFKIGRKHKNTQVFAAYISDSTRSVYGEANVSFYNSEFKLNSSEGSLHTFALSCLAKSFIRNLYGSPAGDILDNYGDFILTDYLTGGKMTALFAGMTRSTVAVKERLRAMDQEINASIDYKTDKGTINFKLDSLNIGKNNGSISGRKSFLEKSYACVNTYGGKHGINMVDNPFDLHTSSINLTPWTQSLDDENTHSIVSIGDGGLIHISDVVLEDNYKKRLKYTSAGYLVGYSRFLPTFIEISRYYIKHSEKYDKDLYGIAAILNTRQGDKIILTDPSDKDLTEDELIKNDDNNVFFAKASQIAEKMKKVFSIEIKSNVYGHFNPHILDPLCEVVTVDFSDMHWIENKNMRLKYIYNKEHKIAFSVYDDELEGDYVLDEYGIRDWYDENCTYKSIALGTITRTFKIIGL